MPDDVVRYPRYPFPPAIISHAVWLYYRFTLSFRDVEDLLAQRGITVLDQFYPPAMVRDLWCGLRTAAPAAGSGPVGDT